MTFPILRKTGLILLFIITAGCSGESTYDSTETTTFFALEQVVSGLVYGYNGRTLSEITGSQASPPKSYTSIESGQYAIIEYPDNSSARENIFYASFTDGSRLYSVWSGVPTARADVTVTFNEQSAGTFNPSNVTVYPDNFDARANINPITDLAFWFWSYDKQKSPYSDYLTSVFLFLQNEFDEFSIPDQNAVHDYPSPALLHLFKEIQIKVAADAAGFSLVNSATGKTRCTGTFALFPVCN